MTFEMRKSVTLAKSLKERQTLTVETTLTKSFKSATRLSAHVCVLYTQLLFHTTQFDCTVTSFGVRGQ